MNRNSFIKNCILGLCSTILPEILRPMEGVVKDGDKCVFNEELINKRLVELRRYPNPMDEKDCTWVAIDWSPPEFLQKYRELVFEKLNSPK